MQFPLSCCLVFVGKWLKRCWKNISLKCFWRWGKVVKKNKCFATVQTQTDWTFLFLQKAKFLHLACWKTQLRSVFYLFLFFSITQQKQNILYLGIKREKKEEHFFSCTFYILGKENATEKVFLTQIITDTVWQVCILFYYLVPCIL